MSRLDFVGPRRGGGRFYARSGGRGEGGRGGVRRVVKGCGVGQDGRGRGVDARGIGIMCSIMRVLTRDIVETIDNIYVHDLARLEEGEITENGINEEFNAPLDENIQQAENGMVGLWKEVIAEENGTGNKSDKESESGEEGESDSESDDSDSSDVHSDKDVKNSEIGDGTEYVPETQLSNELQQDNLNGGLEQDRDRVIDDLIISESCHENVVRRRSLGDDLDLISPAPVSDHLSERPILMLNAPSSLEPARVECNLDGEKEVGNKKNKRTKNKDAPDKEKTRSTRSSMRAKVGKHHVQ